MASGCSGEAEAIQGRDDVTAGDDGGNEDARRSKSLGENWAEQSPR